MREPEILESWLDWAKTKADVFKLVFFAALGAMLALNLFILPHHPHFPAEAMPGFWAVFALLASEAMVLVLKKIIYYILARPEEDENEWS